MTSPASLTWDFDLNVVPPVDARAASLDDLGGAELVDDAAYPPIPPQMPYAAQLNQWALQLAGLNRICVGMVVEVNYVSGVPTIINVQAMSSIITTTWALANLTVTHLATGVVQIAWPDGSLPPARRRARADLYGPLPYPQPQVAPTPHGVQVNTWGLNGTAADINFTVEIY